jgi:itaconate CoA-transferase
MTLPLEGITVVSLEQAVAAPFATRQLADMGARVIKVERPGTGDFARSYDAVVEGLSSHFVWINRSKESIALNLKEEAAREILNQLLEKADVFVQNLAPGATERLGFGTEALRERHPRLIVCDISGYGASGPYRDKKAYDLLVQCEAALVSVTGTLETPSKAGIAVADIAAGMYAYSGILAALFRRERTGEGAVDGLPRLLRHVRRRRAVPQRRQPLLHSTLRALRVRRGRGRLPRHTERSGVGKVLRGRAGAFRTDGRRPVFE